MISDAVFDPPGPTSWVTALDLAEALVVRGVPFREAHGAVGRLVARLMAAGRQLSDATAGDLEAADERFEPSDLELIDPRSSIDRRLTMGGGSVQSVHQQVEALRYALTQ
jgi:argininosuccinate lyase